MMYLNSNKDKFQTHDEWIHPWGKPTGVMIEAVIPVVKINYTQIFKQAIF